MMALDQWLALCLVCLLGAASPGPSLAVVAAATIDGTRRDGIAAALAHGLGVSLYALATVSGLAVLLVAAPALLGAVKLLGAAYLAYLGLRALRSPLQASLAGASARAPLRDGFMIAFLNPKLAVFMLALFSQFLGPTAGWTQKSLMVLTAGAIDAGWYCLVALLLNAPRMRRRFETRGGWVSRGFGILLLVLAVTVTVSVLC